MIWLIMALLLDAPFEPQQKEFVEAACKSDHQITAAFCGLQSGKTKGGAIATRKNLYTNKIVLPPHLCGKQPMDVWILSKDYRLAMEAVDTFRANTPAEIWMSEAECRARGLKRHDAYTWWLAPRKNCVDTLPIRLRARTASDPDGMRSTPTLGFAWADEVAHWKESTWNNLMGRAVVARTRFLVTTTPKGKNFCYRSIAVPGGYKGMPHTDKSISVHWWRSIDNPFANRAFIEKLRLKFGKDYAEQELEGLFTSNIGYVYDFDRTVHMRPLPSTDPADYPVRILGVDPGYSDPYAVGVWLRDVAGDWWLADEFYAKQRTTDDLIPWFAAACTKWGIQRVFVDKRRPSDRLLLQKYLKGVSVQANLDIHAEDDRRTVMPMVRYCQQLFRLNKIHCAPHCEWFAEEAENYAFPDREELNAGENPVDFRNHHMDAMRYAICSVDDIPKASPRFRQGMDQKPRELPMAGVKGKTPVPTMAEAMRMQDRRFDAEAARGQSGRTPDERWLKHRLRNRL